MREGVCMQAIKLQVRRQTGNTKTKTKTKMKKKGRKKKSGSSKTMEKSKKGKTEGKMGVGMDHNMNPRRAKMDRKRRTGQRGSLVRGPRKAKASASLCKGGV